MRVHGLGVYDIVLFACCVVGCVTKFRQRTLVVKLNYSVYGVFAFLIVVALAAAGYFFLKLTDEAARLGGGGRASGTKRRRSRRYRDGSQPSADGVH